ncbi:general odorant-binding protein 56a-like isoform X1 [Ostrinia furnacalis]|uniref:general odorant-binding protein 56a-like isoform X1 n=1 Tax=Ostrinia furnacalis TaxID=93504 RepID=UPI00103E2042|nr:general odorant-binding protein 56a-like isoform X1 [Ostrinia furnacalis]
MKTLVVLAVCFVVAQWAYGEKIAAWRNLTSFTDEQKEKLKKHKSECLSETKVEEALVNKVKTGDYKTENDALKKYALCMMIKSELMTKEGKFKKDVALAKVPNPADKPAVEKVIDACLANKGNTPHQTAWNYVKCYYEKDPKHAILTQ